MQALKTLLEKAPYSKIIVDLVQSPDFPGMVWFTLYMSNLTNFSDQQQLEIINWLRDVSIKANALGYQTNISVEEQA